MFWRVKQGINRTNVPCMIKRTKTGQTGHKLTRKKRKNGKLTRTEKRTEKTGEKKLMDSNYYSIKDVDVMNGFEFEGFLNILFKKMGYEVTQTKLSGDQGADLIVSKLGETTVIQAKRSNGKISNNAIQEVSASIKHYKAQKGMVITNNYFTPSAIELAKSNSIILVDRHKLTDLIKEYL